MNTLPLRPARASLALALLLCLPALLSAATPVKLTQEDVTIPTYLSGPPEPNPMFYFGRNSQGAEGRIYPYPLYDNLTNKKADQTYHIVYLENEYIKIGILPELGGRLFSALDKTDNYDFIYHQHVIKPALIGLIGAWISGGIEWNIPHHHRASTFNPVQFTTEQNPDGSATIWVGELEIRQRMRWAVGYTLHPGKSYLEAKVRIINRTPLAQTMLCFANVAVSADADYQVIYPPDTQLVTYHSKREFANWPVATTRFNGADFTAGVDVSWYKNHLNANSMFAWNYTDDFFAGYDHGKEAGILSIADHHIVPGKKFWTWGNGPRGRMWDDILTDTDGPYIELMVGSYSDNQPDYSWLQPFEERSFSQYWYPFRGLGGVKNANLDAAVNLEVKDGAAKLGFCTTDAVTAATARLTAGDKVLFEQNISIDPGKPFTQSVALPAGTDEHSLHATLTVGGHELVAYTPVVLTPPVIPPVVTPPPAPADIKTVEELYLTGQRIEQFFDPAREPEPYWDEALHRDPSDARTNTAYGIRLIKAFRYAEAETHLRAAVARLTAQYTSPKDGEPFYYLGVALKFEGKNDEAYDAFYKATWSEAWKSPAYFSLAELASLKGDFTAALDFTNRSLDANALNVRALILKSAMLRHLDRKAEALAALEQAAPKLDPLDVSLMIERLNVNMSRGALTDLAVTLSQFPDRALEAAADYANAGLWDDAGSGLSLLVGARDDKSTVPALAFYYLGQYAECMGDAAKSADYRRLAAAASPEYGFPFQAEAIPVLHNAIAANPKDARAPYYLGNLLFDSLPEEAVALWEKSAALDPSFPIVHRNLAVAYSHRPGDAALAQAVAEMEKAVALGERYPVQFFELDQLYEASGVSAEKRLALLEQHPAAVVQRDESTARLINLKTFFGHPDEAITLLSGRTFNIWEGATRFNAGDCWTSAHLARGRARLAAGQAADALADFEGATNFPANLRATPLASRPAEVSYLIGTAQAALGHADLAKAAWQEAASATGGGARGGGGGGGGRRGGQGGGGFGGAAAAGAPRYYQALALQKLGQSAPAETIFRELAATVAPASATAALASPEERQALRARVANAHFTAGLGHAGLGEKEAARTELNAALAASPDHLGAKAALADL